MDNKTTRTLLIVCGILCIVSDVLFITLNCVCKYEIDRFIDIQTIILFFVLGICFCYLGAKTKQ